MQQEDEELTFVTEAAEVAKLIIEIKTNLKAHESIAKILDRSRAPHC